MKILVDLHGFTRTFELDHWQENTTLSDLILAAGGPYIAPDDPLYLDSQPLQGASQLGSVALLEGSVISQRTSLLLVVPEPEPSCPCRKVGPSS